MGAFKEMLIEIECLENAVEEILGIESPIDKGERTPQIAEANGLDAHKLTLHLLWMRGIAGQPYFPEEFLPTSLKPSAIESLLSNSSAYSVKKAVNS